MCEFIGFPRKYCWIKSITWSRFWDERVIAAALIPNSSNDSFSFSLGSEIRRIPFSEVNIPTHPQLVLKVSNQVFGTGIPNVYLIWIDFLISMLVQTNGELK